MPSSRSDRVAALSRLLRDLRSPRRLQRNGLYRGYAWLFDDGSGRALRTAIEVQLHRLPPRQRAVIERYELNREPLATVASDLGLSRRQLFRDRHAGLDALERIVFEEPRPLGAPAPAPLGLVREHSRRGDDRASLARIQIAGLRNAGAIRLAVSELSDLAAAAPTRAGRVDALLTMAEIACDYGDRAAAGSLLASVYRTGGRDGNDSRIEARCLGIESDLASDCDGAIAANEQAVDTLERRLPQRGWSRDDVVYLIDSLCQLSHDYERASRNGDALDAAMRANRLAEQFALESLPVGIAAKVALAYQRARQFANVGAALATLREPLERCLASGWFTPAAQIGVACLSLSVTRSRYADALRWYEWLSSVSVDRLPGFERKTLVYDGTHALTMLRRPQAAIAAIDASHEVGYVYSPSLKVRRAEALEALGDVGGAIRDASEALAGSERAHYVKGIARAKRVLASCYSAVGRKRLARMHLAECVELSQESQMPYDLLRAKVTQSHVMRDEQSRGAALDLARLLLDAGGTDACTPPTPVLT